MNVVVPLFLIAPLVLVPLGYRLLEVASPGSRPPVDRPSGRACQRPGLLVVAFWLPASLVAGVLALPWVAATGATAVTAGLRWVPWPGTIPARRPARDGRRGRLPGGRGGLRAHGPARHPAVRVRGHDHPAHRRPLPLRRVRPAAGRGAGVDAAAEPVARRRRSAPSSSGSRSRPLASSGPHWRTGSGRCSRPQAGRHGDRDAGRRPNPASRVRRRPGRRRRGEPARRHAARRPSTRPGRSPGTAWLADRHHGSGPRRPQRPGASPCRRWSPGRSIDAHAPPIEASDRRPTPAAIRDGGTGAGARDHRRLRLRRRAHSDERPAPWAS